VPLVLAILLMTVPAFAGDVSGEAPFQRARDAERAGDPVAEYAACTDVIAAGTSARETDTCRRRLSWLTARRDTDLGFAGLTELAAVRKGWRELSSDEARARVAAVAAHPGVAPRIRDEAEVWLAREALEQQGDPAAALRWTGPLWERIGTHSANDLRPQVADLHARTLLATGDAPAAQAVEAATQPPRSAQPQEGLPLAQRHQRRERIRQSSWVGLALFGLIVGPAAARGWRQRPRPRVWGLIPLALLGAGAASLAALQDPSTLPAFCALLLIFSAIHVTAAGALTASTPPGGEPPARARQLGLRAVVAVGTLSAAFLCLEHFALVDRLGL
jgi:hypothetical protein